jgi:hypothetical protein
MRFDEFEVNDTLVKSVVASAAAARATLGILPALLLPTLHIQSLRLPQRYSGAGAALQHHVQAHCCGVHALEKSFVLPLPVST